MNKTNYTVNHYTPKQGRFPVFIADNLDICDPVLAFDEIMEEIEIWRYLKPDGYKEPGRPRYNKVNMLKTILFSFRDTGYAFKNRYRRNIYAYEKGLYGQRSASSGIQCSGGCS